MTSYGYRIDHTDPADHCCGSHTTTCEPPGELCCGSCSEFDHYHALTGERVHKTCVLDPCDCTSEQQHRDTTQNKPPTTSQEPHPTPGQRQYMRWQVGQPRESRVISSLALDHPAAKFPCPLCRCRLGDGRPIQMLAIGPDSPDKRTTCADGQWFSAAALFFHAECLGTPVS